MPYTANRNPYSPAVSSPLVLLFVLFRKQASETQKQDGEEESDGVSIHRQHWDVFHAVGLR